MSFRPTLIGLESKPFFAFFSVSLGFMKQVPAGDFFFSLFDLVDAIFPPPCIRLLLVPPPHVGVLSPFATFAGCLSSSAPLDVSLSPRKTYPVFCSLPEWEDAFRLETAFLVHFVLSDPHSPFFLFF